MTALRMLVLVFLTACGNTPQGSAPSPPQSARPLPERSQPTEITVPIAKPLDEKTVQSSAHPLDSSKTEQPAEAVQLPPPCPRGTSREEDGMCQTPRLSESTCASHGQVLGEDGRSCREKRFANYCRAGTEVGEEEQLTVSRILNGLHLSDCEDVERYLERQPTLILPAQGQKIADLRPIATLKMLRVLHIPNNRIVDVSPLATLTNLEVLNLRNNAVSDLSPLVALPKLRRLDIAGNEIRDMSALSKLPSLVRIQTGPASDPLSIEKREPVTMRDISTGTLE